MKKSGIHARRNETLISSIWRADRILDHRIIGPDRKKPPFWGKVPEKVTSENKNLRRRKCMTPGLRQTMCRFERVMTGLPGSDGVIGLAESGVKPGASIATIE